MIFFVIGLELLGSLSCWTSACSVAAHGESKSSSGAGGCEVSGIRSEDEADGTAGHGRIGRGGNIVMVPACSVAVLGVHEEAELL